MDDRVITINDVSGQEFKRKVAELPSDKTHLKNVCKIPWTNVNIDEYGNIFICACAGWLPYSVGHVLEFNSFNEIFASPKAKQIHNSITDLKYTYCATQFCNFDDTKKPTQSFYSLNLNIDRSCNISCPSCREEVIFDNNDSSHREKLAWAETMVSWVKTSKKRVVVTLGAGDPFASRLYSKIIELFADEPRVYFMIATNGLLIEKNIKIIKKILMRSAFTVSIDAATKQTYEIVRRGARWEQLHDNLRYLAELDKPVQAGFVIQRQNFREMLDFVELCQRYKMIPNFQILEDWGTWTDFDEHCVHRPSSQHYEEFMSYVKVLQTMGIKFKI